MHSMISYSVRRGSVQSPLWRTQRRSRRPTQQSRAAGGRVLYPSWLSTLKIYTAHALFMLMYMHPSPGHTCMRHANRRGPCRITCRAPAGVRAFSFTSKSRSLDPRIAILIALNSCKDLQKGALARKKKMPGSVTPTRPIEPPIPGSSALRIPETHLGMPSLCLLHHVRGGFCPPA